MALDDFGFVIYEVIDEPPPPPPPPPPLPEDSLLDLCAPLVYGRFFREPNWITLPKGDFDESREISEHPGTALDIYSLVESLATSLTYGFTNLNKEDEYEIINFFCNRRGRHKRFWIPFWKNPFLLAADIKEGDTVLTIQNCYYNLIEHGEERIFFKLKNGYVLTRKAVAIVPNGTAENIILETSIDRDIARNKIKFFGRLLLARFNTDILNLKFHSDNKSDCILTFRELPFEYCEVES